MLERVLLNAVVLPDGIGRVLGRVGVSTQMLPRLLRAGCPPGARARVVVDVVVLPDHVGLDADAGLEHVVEVVGVLFTGSGGMLEHDVVITVLLPRLLGVGCWRQSESRGGRRPRQRPRS